jgi:hypothetical protein
VGNEQRLRGYLQRVESPLFVVGLTTLYPELSRRLSADAAKQGYGFLDLTNVFDAANFQTFTDYCHLTPDGNRIIADRLFDALRDSLGTGSIAISSCDIPPTHMSRYRDTRECTFGTHGAWHLTSETPESTS